MESTQKYENKLNNFKRSLEDLQSSLSINPSGYSEREGDVIKNGQLQKFEITFEQCWKAIKSFLIDKHGIESVSPKSTIKEFYLGKFIDENEYELLLQMLIDRNSLSHIYSEIYMNQIHSRLKDHFSLLEKIYSVLANEN